MIKFIKPFLINFFAVVLTLTSTVPVYSDVNSTTVKVGYYNIPGIISVDTNNTASGFLVDYLDKIASYTKFDYEYINTNSLDAYNKLNNNNIDILFETEPIDKNNLIYSKHSIYEQRQYLFAKEESNVTYEDFSSVNGKKIGIINTISNSSYLETYANDNNFSYTLVSYNNFIELKNAITNGEIDIIFSIETEDFTDLDKVAFVYSEPVYIAADKKNSHIILEIDKAISVILNIDPNFTSTLNDKYFVNLNNKLYLTKEELQYIQNSDPIPVALAVDLLPIEYLDKDGNCTGSILEIYDYISQKTGLTFEFQSRAGINKLKRDFKLGNVKMLGITVDNAEVRKDLNIKTTDTIMSLALNMVCTDANIVNDKNILLAFAETTSPYIDVAKSLGYTNFVEYATIEDCIMAVRSGKAGATIVPEKTVEVYMNHSYYAMLTSIPLFNTKYNYCIGVYNSDENDILLSIVNKALQSLTLERLNTIRTNNFIRAVSTKTTKDILYDNSKLLIFIIVLLLVIILIASHIKNKTKTKINAILENMNNSLKITIEEKEIASAAKTDFLSRMSHDLRTPLNGIIGASEIAIDEIDSKDNVINYLTQINSSGRFMLGLVNDILDMNKIESGKVNFILEPYTQKQLIFDIKSMFEPLCVAKNINFTIQPSDIQLNVMVDILRLKQIFFNLLSNSIKYTPDGGSVEFKITTKLLTNKTESVTFIVKDTGIGMTQDFQKKMYEPFTQEKTGNTVTIQGTGLGLPIAKKLVELMGGTIECNSKVGIGTTFTITIPMLLADYTEIESETEANKDEIWFDKQLVLIAEDQNLNALIAQKQLEKVNLTVERVTNGKEAVEKFSSSPQQYYSAILMDIRMPIMDGIEATKAIRNLNRKDAKTIPIIAMTANAFEEDIKTSIEAGMSEHLTKPIDTSVLYSTLKKHIK